MSAAVSGTELFPFLFATWVFELHVAGQVADDPQIREACEAVRAATEPVAGNQAGNALVERVRQLLPQDEPQEVLAAARRLYGDKVRSDLGQGDRTERSARIRKYEFSHQLPWLARIWERQGDRVAPSWLLIERVTDEVRVADPNPWNDTDETRHLPVTDFQVLWELDGCTSIHLEPPAQG